MIGIDVNKTSGHYWYFLDKDFKFQSIVCNGYHDLLTMSRNLSYTTILNIINVDYDCNISGISKSEAINLLQNISLTKKRERKF